MAEFVNEECRHIELSELSELVVTLSLSNIASKCVAQQNIITANRCSSPKTPRMDTEGDLA